VADPDAVQSLDAFARACNRLRGARSYADLARSARPRSLPSATLSDLLNGRSAPTADTVVSFLIACGLDEAARRPWLAAWERAATAHRPRPDGAVRVRDARPRLLGVHAAIRVPGATGELPPYVPRDLDADLRAAVTAAAAGGGFVLLLGSSSVGKTRALTEAVRAVLPEWWLLHPADAPAIGAHAAAPTPRTVLWLDELQRFLNHPAGLPIGTVQRLITAGTAVVATLWPDEYRLRTVRPGADRPDPYANDRDLLGLAHVVQVPGAFSTAERRRGETLAPADGRIRVALDTHDAGFTQVMAAGPELIRSWEQAPDRHCYGAAVVTAALDARRVGARQPLTRAFLDAAAPAYLAPAQQATAPADWLDRALGYATTPVHGAAACLAPVPAGMGRVAGYTVADYLHQHARRVRRAVAVPDLVWQALLAHHHPDDRAALAGGAERRGRLDEAIALHQRAAAAGDTFATDWLVDALTAQGRVDELLDLLRTGDDGDRLNRELAKYGRVDELRDRADAGDQHAAWTLPGVLAAHGRVDELRDRADAGDEEAAGTLARELARQECVDELRDRADRGDERAAVALVHALVEQGRADEVRDRAERGDSYAGYRLADAMAEEGRLDELRDGADRGDELSARALTYALVRRDRVHEALQVLLADAGAGEGPAADQLTGVPADRGSVDTSTACWLAGVLIGVGYVDQALQVLRHHADAGDWYCATKLVDTMVEQGRLDALRDRADTGDPYAADRLIDVLARQGRVEELRDRADGGDHGAADRLIDVLIAAGRVEEALRALRDRADAGDPRAADRMLTVLADQGRVEELRRRADAGDWHAAAYLAGALDRLGRGDEALLLLREGVRTGRAVAGTLLVDMLVRQGHEDELRDRADAGDWHAATKLVDILVEQGRDDELRDRADAGDFDAARRFVEVLARQGRVEELRGYSDAGDPFAGQLLVDILVRQGRIEELKDEVAAGTWSAVHTLRGLTDPGGPAA
jgi:hypothetical protein